MYNSLVSVPLLSIMMSLTIHRFGFFFFFSFFAPSLESLAWFLFLVCHRLLKVSLTSFIFSWA